MSQTIEETEAFFPTRSVASPTWCQRVWHILAFSFIIAHVCCMVTDIYFSVVIVLPQRTFPIDTSIWLVINGLTGAGLVTTIVVYWCRPFETKCLSYLFIFLTFFMSVWTIMGWWTFGESYGVLANSDRAYLWTRLALQSLVCGGSLLYIIRHFMGMNE